MKKKISFKSIACVISRKREVVVPWVNKVAIIAACLAFFLLFSSFICSVDIACAASPGLVAWWPGDGNAHDIVGGHNGTFAAGTYAPGMAGQAFNFDGTSDYVVIQNGLVPNNARNFTVEAWAYPGVLDNQSRMMVYGGSTAGEYEFLINDTNNYGFGVKLTNGSWYKVSSPAASGKWSHIIGIRRGQTIELWVDGVLKASDSSLEDLDLQATGNGSNNSRIGAYNEFNDQHKSYWSGFIDEVKIYTAALSNQEITTEYNSGVAGHNKPCVQAPSGLVSWWSGDDTALDMVGTNNGILSGTTYDAQAFKFDGIDDYVSVPASSNWAFGTGDFTVEFWTFGTSDDFKRPLINNRKTPASDNMWAIEIYGVANRVEFHSGLNIFLEATNLLTSSSWNHVAVIRNSGLLSMYINGNLSGSIANTTNFSEINDLQVGRDIMDGNQLLGRTFQGLMDEVAIFNRALSQAEIQAIYNAGSAGKCKDCFMPPSGLVSWWPGEGDATDISGPNNGTFSANTYANGRVGQAFSFDGVDDYVSVGMLGNVGLNESFPFTVSAWINVMDVNAYQAIAGNYMGEGGGTYNFSTYIGINSGLLFFALNQRQRAGISVSTPIVTGWHHVSGTYDGNNIFLYLDGQQKGTAARSFSGSTDNTRGWYLGNFSPETTAAHGYQSSFIGQIDEIATFSRALSMDEVRGVYQAGLGVCKSCFMPQNGLVSRWRGEGDSKDARGINNGSVHSDFLALILGQAFNFAGTGDYVTMTDTNFPSGNSPRTVDFWFSTSDDTTERYMFSYGAANSNQRFSVGLYSGYLHAENNGSGLHGSTLLNSVGAHHAAATWDGFALNLFVDGNKETLTPVAVSWPASLETTLTGQASIGRLNSGGLSYTGLLDEVGIYNRALTADEIAWKYSCIADSNPNPYSLTSQFGMYPGTTASSSFIVTGINMPLSIRISSIPQNGFFGINGGACNLQDATVVTGDVVQVCLDIPGFPPGQQVSTEVTVGLGINVPPATFTVTSTDYAVARESAARHYYFGSLQEAYNNVIDTNIDTIIAKESLTPGALDCSDLSDQSVTIIGGYDPLFGPGTGAFTTITPTLVISRGTVTLENILVQ
ncbi:MAG: hypothetical protein C0402_06845 [Thermodesulfovibrio sp.]|nr:hypothetical protein [Thermodesulfovibrio sp.]